MIITVFYMLDVDVHPGMYNNVVVLVRPALVLVVHQHIIDNPMSMPIAPDIYIYTRRFYECADRQSMQEYGFNNNRNGRQTG